jgi:hypothetical protein
LLSDTPAATRNPLVLMATATFPEDQNIRYLRGMSAIIIRSNKQNNKILAELAKKLGGDVIDLEDEQFEDFMLGRLMDSVKTGKTVSREAVMRKLIP